MSNTRRRAVWLILAAGVVVSGYAAARIVADRQLTRLLPTAIAEAVGGRDANAYVVTVGDLDIAATLNGVQVRDLEVSLDPGAATDMSEPALVRSARISSLRVSGLRLLPLLRGKGIMVASVELEGPTVSLDFPASSAAPPSGAGESSTDVESETDTFRPPETELRRIRIRDGAIDMTRATNLGTLTSVLHNLDLTLTEIRVDSVSLANPVAALANSRVTVAFDTVYHVLDDSLYFVAAAHVRADSRDSVAEIGVVSFTPTLEAAPFFGRLPKRADRLNVTAGPIRVTGLDFADYVRDAAVRVRSIEVDSADVHVYSDIALDWGPKARPCAYHAGFAEIPIPFRVDTVRALHARLRYSELARGSTRPGELVFEDVNAVVTNLTNDPERMTVAEPAVARLEGRLYGEAPVSATVRYPLLAPTLDFDVEVSAGGMSLLPANRFATNVTGVEVKQGRLDSLSLELQSRAGHATGRIDMRYRDLNFRFLDRNTGKEMVWHSVLGFLGNVAVRSSNPGRPGEEAREANLDYSCGDQDMVFFEFLVHALVTGLKRIVLII